MKPLQRRQPASMVIALALVCVLTAIALVYTKHESRKLFVEQLQPAVERGAEALLLELQRLGDQRLRAAEVSIVERAPRLELDRPPVVLDRRT